MAAVAPNAPASATPRSASSASAIGPTKSPHTLSRGKLARSTSTVRNPPAASRAAAAAPAGPPPTTTTSQSCPGPPARAGWAGPPAAGWLSGSIVIPPRGQAETLPANSDRLRFPGRPHRGGGDFATAQRKVFDNPRPTIPAVNEPIPEQ